MASATSSAVIPAPSGEVTDFDAPNELWKWNVLCQAMSLGVPGIMFLLRLYVRIWVKRVWILEDCMCFYNIHVLLRSSNSIGRSFRVILRERHMATDGICGYLTS